MTPRPTRTPCAARTWRAGVAVVLAGCLVPLAGGCSAAGTSGALPETTITVTEASAPIASTPSGASSISDVTGRRFDLGQVQSVRTADGTQVVELDRWTSIGVSDSRLAQDGLPVAAHHDTLYVNQNSTKTYTAIVAPQAQVVENTCVPIGGGRYGLVSRPRPAAKWLEGSARGTLLLVTYDEQSRIIRLDTDPHC